MRRRMKVIAKSDKKKNEDTRGKNRRDTHGM